MIRFWSRKQNKDVSKIAERELSENKKVIESLRDYDEGKKDISTDEVRGRIPRVRTPSS